MYTKGEDNKPKKLVVRLPFIVESTDSVNKQTRPKCKIKRNLGIHEIKGGLHEEQKDENELYGDLKKRAD